MLTLAVIADTHIADRRRTLPQAVFDAFRAAKPAAILHAGDITLPRVLHQLEEIAPVIAVRGNRDWFIPNLPMHRRLQYEGVSIGLTHGHGSWKGYLKDKLHYLAFGPRKFRYIEEQVLAIFPDTQVVVFGHNHVPVNRMEGEQLLFNPGSPCCPNPFMKNVPATIGLLHIDGSTVRGEIVQID